MDNVQLVQAGTEGTDPITAAKNALKAAKQALAKAEGKEPGRRGKPPLGFEAVQLTGMVDKAKLDSLKAKYPDLNNTQLIRLMLDIALNDNSFVAEPGSPWARAAEKILKEQENKEFNHE